MNQKDWVEYFEAMNGRKPTASEFSKALENGLFVLDRKQENESSNIDKQGTTMTEKEWIESFETKNGRKPRNEVIDLAISNKAFKKSGFARILSVANKRILNSHSRLIVSVCSLITVIGTFLFFLFGSNWINSNTYEEIEPSMEPLDVLGVSLGDFETLAGTWISEVREGEPSVILTISDEGVIKFFSKDKSFLNKGTIIISNEDSDTWTDGYITVNVKGKIKGEERHIYASGHEGYQRDYNLHGEHMYIIQGNSNFVREEIGFDYTRRQEISIRQDIPTKITKDTLIFQDTEKPHDDGNAVPSSLSYTVFHRKDEMNTPRNFEKSEINLKEIRKDDFSSISGYWETLEGKNSLKIYNNGDVVSSGSAYSEGIIRMKNEAEGDLGVISGQWIKPIYANGSIGTEVEGIDRNNFSIRKAGEEVGATLDTTLYDMFERPDEVPKLAIIHTDVLLLKKSYDEDGQTPSEVYYRSSTAEIERLNRTDVTKSDSSLKGTMNIYELQEGIFTSIIGKWENKNGDKIEIEESGYLYWGDSLGYPLQDIKVNSDKSAGGFLNRNLVAGMSPNTRDYVTFIPAGISIPGGENADITKDRIGLSGTIDGYNDPLVYYRVE